MTFVTLLLMAQLAADSFSATGGASYYADQFKGRRTASGERYDPKDFTAAHRKLPFGTRILVTRVDTGETVVVRMNDRGPFVKGRVIDLSRAAAEKIGMVRRGTCRVRLQDLPVNTEAADVEAVPMTESVPDSPVIESVAYPEETR